MVLGIGTFSNVTGGSSFFKAAGHPLAAPKALALIEDLAAAGRIAIYDPLGQAAEFAALYDISSWDIAAVYVQSIESLGAPVLGRQPRPVTELAAAEADVVFVAAFDADRLVQPIGHLTATARVVTLDALRLPDDMLTKLRHYLHPLNFATNFAFFRDADGLHTTLATANYWHGHGARGVELWLCLFDSDGETLAEWREPLPDADASIIIDSADVRRRFGLGDFTGSLFVHALGAAGHDIVKYALDTYGDDERALSCTHDANAWPAELYAGLPAPRAGETVLLWVQNSHPTAIPAGAVALNPMGSAEEAREYDQKIPPFATRAIDVGGLLPDLRWPAQVEIRAGHHFVRPRYEIIGKDGARRIAHANVERTDLAYDPRIPELGDTMGKGYILPAPVLPLADWHSLALPTPMATCQEELPIQIIVYDATGREVLRQGLGRLPRDHATAVDIDDLLETAGTTLDSGWGHFELAYDFSSGGGGDGWLHGLFRYEHRRSGHGADTSFGAHMYNLPITYRGEPQSYAGRPPGLSTRLFLRLGSGGLETLCHLIYPASGAWHDESATHLVLYDGAGATVAERGIRVPCSGSLLWRYSEMFGAAERAQAGDAAYVIVRDTTCRLFGFHGLLGRQGGFSFDHMFGF